MTREDEPLEPLLTITQVAEILGVTTRTIYRMLSDNELRSNRVGHRTRFEPSEIRRYIAASRVDSTHIERPANGDEPPGD